MISHPVLRPPLYPALAPMLEAPGEQIRPPAFGLLTLFKSGYPGTRVSIEEALRINEAAMGPELCTNPTLPAGVTQDGEWFVFNGAASNTVLNFAQGVIGSSLKAYRVTLEIQDRVQGDVRVAIGASGAAPVPAYISANFSNNGVYSFVVTGANNTATSIIDRVGIHVPGGAGVTATLRAHISVREIDLSKCVAFQDSAGTIPVTDVEQPLGLVLDYKTGQVEHGPELVTDGGLQNGLTYWNVDAGWTISDGVAEFTQPGTGYQNLSGKHPKNYFIVAGRTYRIEFDVLSGSGGFRAIIGGGTGPFAFGPNSGGAGTRYTCILLALSDGHIRVGGSNVTGSGSVTNISVREVLGTHHIQPTSTKRPVVSRRANLLTATENFTTWEKASLISVSPAAIANPAGGTGAFLVSCALDTTGVSKFLRRAVNVIEGVVYRVVFTVKQSSSHAHVGVRLNSAGITRFNLATKTVEVLGNATAAGFIELGDGWLGVWADYIGGASGTRYATLVPCSPTAVAEYAPTTGSEQCYVFSADLRLSIDANLPSYQRVTSPTDYDTEGFPAYARYNGVDQYLETAGTLDMTSTDEVTVLAGVAKLSDAATGMAIEIGPDVGLNNGTFALSAPSSNGANSYRFGSRGTMSIYGGTGVFAAAPDKALLTGTAKINASSGSLRRNGVHVAANASNQGTGNYSNRKLYIGARGGTTFFFSGRIYSWTVIGKNLSPAQLAAAEALDRRLGRLW